MVMHKRVGVKLAPIPKKETIQIDQLGKIVETIFDTRLNPCNQPTLECPGLDFRAGGILKIPISFSQ